MAYKCQSGVPDNSELHSHRHTIKVQDIKDLTHVTYPVANQARNRQFRYGQGKSRDESGRKLSDGLHNLSLVAQRRAIEHHHDDQG